MGRRAERALCPLGGQSSENRSQKSEKRKLKVIICPLSCQNSEFRVQNSEIKTHPFAPSDEGAGEPNAMRRDWGREKTESLIYLCLSLRLCGEKFAANPPQALSRCPKFAELYARANFDRFAALASLFPPPAALRRRRPSEGGKGYI